MSTDMPMNYVCPKHPDIHSDRPGNCSKCGSKMEQRDDNRSTTGGSRPNKPERERER
jgi:hypothetical protein